jgi:hypothetical protein
MEGNQCQAGLTCNDQNRCIEDTSSTNPEDANRISGYIDTLPWGPEEIDAAGKRDEFIDAVMKSCAEFMPSDDEWQIWCQAFLVAAACRESSLGVEYIDDSDHANPTVGLLQVDFYFAVQEFDDFGNKAVLARCGCEWPDFSSVDWDNDAWKWVDWMQGIHCNVAVGSWYYFRNATTNGGPDACFVECACQGNGTPANLAIGMLSHFAGPAAALNLFTSGGYEEHTYYSWVKEWFDAMISPTPNPHPFLRELQPHTSQFCEN